MSGSQSASQTAGPYVHIGCTPKVAGLKNMYGGHDLGTDIFPPDVPGRKIVISGQIFDGAGDPVLDAMLEFWQADAPMEHMAAGPAGRWILRRVATCWRRFFLPPQVTRLRM